MKANIQVLHDNQSSNEAFKAQVKTVSKNAVLIDTGLLVINAQQAFSCIVTPEVDDVVLVHQLDAEYYILAILQRASKQSMNLSFPDDVTIQAPNGQVEVFASKQLSLISSDKAQILASDIALNSQNMHMQSGNIKSNAQQVEVCADNITVTCCMLNTIAKQVSQRADVLVRWVETVETLNIGNLVQKIRHNYSSHAQQTVITAKQDIRVDAERIHMG